MNVTPLSGYSSEENYADCNCIEDHRRASLALIKLPPSRQFPSEFFELLGEARGDVVLGFALAKSEVPLHLMCGYDSELGRMPPRFRANRTQNRLKPPVRSRRVTVPFTYDNCERLMETQEKTAPARNGQF